MDLFGNAVPAAVLQGLTLVSLCDPSYHVFEGAGAMPRFLHLLVTVPDRVSPGPDGQAPLELELRNPLDREVTVHADVEALDLAVLDSTPARTIPANGVAVLPFRLGTGSGRFGEVGGLGGAVTGISVEPLGNTPSIRLVFRQRWISIWCKVQHSHTPIPGLARHGRGDADRTVCPSLKSRLATCNEFFNEMALQAECNRAPAGKPALQRKFPLLCAELLFSAHV
jgi:hypothetical protein